MATMTPGQVITLICSIVMCVIGIATFVSAKISTAKKDGQLEYKVDALLKSVDELKETIKETGDWKDKFSVKTERHEQNIKTLFNRIDKTEAEIEEIKKQLSRR